MCSPLNTPWPPTSNMLIVFSSEVNILLCRSLIMSSSMASSRVSFFSSCALVLARGAVEASTPLTAREEGNEGDAAAGGEEGEEGVKEESIGA